MQRLGALYCCCSHSSSCCCCCRSCCCCCWKCANSMWCKLLLLPIIYDLLLLYKHCTMAKVLSDFFHAALKRKFYRLSHRMPRVALCTCHTHVRQKATETCLMMLPAITRNFPTKNNSGLDQVNHPQIDAVICKNSCAKNLQINSPNNSSSNKKLANSLSICICICELRKRSVYISMMTNCMASTD